MRRLLLSTLSLAVIAFGGTTLTAQDEIGEGDDTSDWRRCYDDCRDSGKSYAYCREDCRVFEPSVE